VNKGFTLLEIMIVVAVLSIIFVALASGAITMLNEYQSTSNQYQCAFENTMVMFNIAELLKEARADSITVSGTAQTYYAEFTASPANSGNISVYPVVTFTVPVGFRPTLGTVVYSNDTDAATYADSNHPLKDYVPCSVRFFRDSATGCVIQRMVKSGSNVDISLGRCEQASTVKDTSGNYLPGLAFYVYISSLTNKKVVSVMLTTAAGDKIGTPQFWQTYSTITKLVPIN
jgi:prepilin-type N-terminal cleavage/methylation domain-containing protein